MVAIIVNFTRASWYIFFLRLSTAIVHLLQVSGKFSTRPLRFSYGRYTVNPFLHVCFTVVFFKSCTILIGIECTWYLNLLFFFKKNVRAHGDMHVETLGNKHVDVLAKQGAHDLGGLGTGDPGYVLCAAEVPDFLTAGAVAAATAPPRPRRRPCPAWRGCWRGRGRRRWRGCRRR
eukprot:SAG11_NODE_959_length_6385_cov_30.010181_7_plen_175_part_00